MNLPNTNQLFWMTYPGTVRSFANALPDEEEYEQIPDGTMIVVYNDTNPVFPGFYPIISLTKKEPEQIPVTRVSVSNVPLQVKTGTTHALGVTVLPSDATDKSITWSSTNNAVATVNSSGVVTALSSGSVHIRATANDGSGKFNVASFDVGEETLGNNLVPCVYITGIPSEMKIGKTYALGAEVTPSNTGYTIAWGSENPSIAIISDTGVVTPIAEGTSDITAAVDFTAGIAPLGAGIMPLSGTIGISQTSASANSNASDSVPVKVSRNSYKITFDKNANDDIVSNMPLEQEITISIPYITPIRARHKFLGWSKSKLAIIPTFFAGDRLEDSRNVTLFAVWRTGGMGTTEPEPITQDGFGGWYYPDVLNEGVKSRVARFVQMGSGPCFAYCEMMGDYYLRFRDIDVNEFFNNRFIKGAYGNKDSYGNDIAYLIGNNAQWVNTKVEDGDFSDFEDLKPVLIRELNLGKPVIISRRTKKNNGTTEYNHGALVVAYKGEGETEEDFILIDPYYPNTSFPLTYAEFRVKYPSNTVGFGYINQTRIFNDI